MVDSLIQGLASEPAQPVLTFSRSARTRCDLHTARDGTLRINSTACRFYVIAARWGERAAVEAPPVVGAPRRRRRGRLAPRARRLNAPGRSCRPQPPPR